MESAAESVGSKQQGVPFRLVFYEQCDDGFKAASIRKEEDETKEELKKEEGDIKVTTKATRRELCKRELHMIELKTKTKNLLTNRSIQQCQDISFCHTQSFSEQVLKTGVVTHCVDWWRLRVPSEKLNFGRLIPNTSPLDPNSGSTKTLTIPIRCSPASIPQSWPSNVNIELLDRMLEPFQQNLALIAATVAPGMGSEDDCRIRLSCKESAIGYCEEAKHWTKFAKHRNAFSDNKVHLPLDTIYDLNVFRGALREGGLPVTFPFDLEIECTAGKDVGHYSQWLVLWFTHLETTHVKKPKTKPNWELSHGFQNIKKTMAQQGRQSEFENMNANPYHWYNRKGHKVYHSPNSSRMLGLETRMFPLAVRVVCSVLSNEVEKVMLDVDARPFYPDSLTRLFDNYPQQIERGPSVNVPAFPCVELEPLMGVVQLRSNEHMTSPTYNRIMSSLQEEERCMATDMRMFDLLESRLRPATGQGDLYLIHVPGLLEKRPQLIYGDIVRIQFPQYPGEFEMQGQVHSMQGNDIRTRLIPMHPILQNGSSLLESHEIRCYVSFVSNSDAFRVMMFATHVVLSSLMENLHGAWLNDPAADQSQQKLGWPELQKLRSSESGGVMRFDVDERAGDAPLLKFGLDSHEAALLASHTAHVETVFDGEEEREALDLKENGEIEASEPESEEEGAKDNVVVEESQKEQTSAEQRQRENEFAAQLEDLERRKFMAVQVEDYFLAGELKKEADEIRLKQTTNLNQHTTTLSDEAIKQEQEKQEKKQVQSETGSNVPAPRPDPVEPIVHDQTASSVFDSLNFEQQCCVADIVHSESLSSYPYAVHGPPGTGKTRVVVAAAQKIIDAGQKVLIVTPSNAAADVVISRCGELPNMSKKCFRHVSFQRPLDQVPIGVKRFTYVDALTGLFGTPPLEELASYSLIACTCTSAVTLLQAGILPGHFSHIIFDEAGQATEPETYVPLMLAVDKTKIALVGDPLQLSPVIRSPDARKLGLRKSLLERLLESPAYMKGAHNGVTVRTTLLQNYRSHETLLALPSKRFYQGLLVAKADKNQSQMLNAWEELPNKEQCPLLFYGVAGHHEREGNTLSYFNKSEVAVVVELVQKLLTTSGCGATPEDIGIIAPFRKQVYKIRHFLRERHLGQIRVGTVDDYQGQEEKIIFISTVVGRNQKVGSEITSLQTQGVGLLGSNQRFNVAITRAKALLVIVGDPIALVGDSNWYAMLRRCHEKNAYRGAPCPGMTITDSSTQFDPDKSEEASMTQEEEEEDLSDAVNRMAELMLGSEDWEKMFPDEEDLDMHYRDEMEFRVML